MIKNYPVNFYLHGIDCHLRDAKNCILVRVNIAEMTMPEMERACLIMKEAARLLNEAEANRVVAVNVPALAQVAVNGVEAPKRRGRPKKA